MTIILAYFFFILDNILREVLRDRNKAKRFHKGTDDKKSSILNTGYILFVPLTPLIMLSGFGTFDSILLQWGGIVLQIVALCVRAVAMQTLGKFYTGILQITKEHILVKSGIYGIVRHPGYLSVLLLSVGFGLAIGNWIALSLIIVMFFLIYSYRITTEEAMLIKKFGSEYAKYKRMTKRLIPFIY